MEQVRDHALANDRFTVVLFSSFDGAALLLGAIGCGIGLIGALLADRMMRTLLYRIAGTDVTAFTASAATLFVTALLACVIRALSAALADRMQSLRID